MVRPRGGPALRCRGDGAHGRADYSANTAEDSTVAAMADTAAEHDMVFATEQLAELWQRYGYQEMQPDSVPGLLERFGLRIAERSEVI